jgi:hypothetical protein
MLRWDVVRPMRFSFAGLVLFTSVACAAAPPPTPMVPASGGATLSIAVDPLIRVVRPDARRPGTNIVAEIQGSDCRVGSEQGHKLGVWLRMPRSSCPHDLAEPGDVPHVLDATDDVVFDANDAPDPAPLRHLTSLATPIDWIPGRDGITLARRFFAKNLAAHPDLTNDRDVIRARNNLAMYDDEARFITDRPTLIALCAKTNDLACEHAAAGAKTKEERRGLLGRGCQLENSNACYALGVELRTDAAEALKRNKELQAFHDFQCGLGKRSNITPLTYEAVTCPPPSGAIAH